MKEEDLFRGLWRYARLVTPHKLGRRYKWILSLPYLKRRYGMLSSMSRVIE